MLDGMNFNLNGTSVFLKFLGSEYPKFGVFDGEEIYKVQDVLVYMPPTITYIYGLNKKLIHVDIIDNYQICKCGIGWHSPYSKVLELLPGFLHT